MRGRVKTGIITIMLLALAACGALTDEEPTPTPAPTLTAEERAQLPMGTADNPLRMVIRPVHTVPQRIEQVLIAELGVLPGRVGPDARLRDELEIDSLDVLNPALRRDFSVEISGTDAPDLNTVSDLVAYVQAALGDRVAAEMFDRTGIYFEVVTVPGYARALTEVCASGSGIVSIAWLDGLTYRAGVERNCGMPALEMAVSDAPRQEFELLAIPAAPDEPVGDDEEAEATPEVTPETTPDPEETPEADGEVEAPDEAVDDEPADDENGDEEAAVDDEANGEDENEVEATPEVTPEPEDEPAALRVGARGVIIADASLGSSSLGVVQGRTLCRRGVDDFYSWFLPALILEQNGIDPVRAPEAIVDYADTRSLVGAVARGDCALAGLSEDAWRALEPVDGATVIQTTVPFPYGVLLYPLEIELGVRLSLNENLIALAEDEDAGRALRLLLGQDALVPTPTDELTLLNSFLSATGRNFQQLGN
jgi:acyl carrier protein